MFNAKKIITTGAVVLSGLAFSVGAFAQSPTMSLDVNGSGNVTLHGTVSAVSAPNLSVTSWGGTWTVNTTGAKFLPPNAPTLADVKVGDMVKISGKITSGMNITATHVTDKSLRPTKPGVKVGTINNLNTTAGTFTLAGNNGQNINVTTTSGASVFLNGSNSTFASLANNMKVVVSGAFNSVTNSISANIIQAFNLGSDVDIKVKGNKHGFWVNLFGAFKNKKDK